MNDNANHQPSPATDSPPRIPLSRLAAKGPASPALLRVVGQAALRGPGRVAVAAFQSSV